MSPLLNVLNKIKAQCLLRHKDQEIPMASLRQRSIDPRRERRPFLHSAYQMAVSFYTVTHQTLCHVPVVAATYNVYYYALQFPLSKELCLSDGNFNLCVHL